MLHITDAARERIQRALASASPDRELLRIEVGLRNGAFDYRMAAITAADLQDHDRVLDHDGLRIVLDGDSAARLEGATVDYQETLLESGFRFDNPNQPQSPVLPSGARPDLQGPIADRVRHLLDSEINPAIAAHGGRVSLVDARDGRVHLAFGGGCHGCGLVDVTLKQGIEARIREVVPEVVEVVDTTDHATGENPYYR